MTLEELASDYERKVESLRKMIDARTGSDDDPSVYQDDVCRMEAKLGVYREEARRIRAAIR